MSWGTWARDRVLLDGPFFIFRASFGLGIDKFYLYNILNSMLKTFLISFLCLTLTLSVKFAPSHYTVILSTITEPQSHLDSASPASHLQAGTFINVPVDQANQNIDRYIRNQVK